MNLTQFARQSDRFVREYDYGETRVFAVDLGRSDATVDVVDDTAIVAFEDGDQIDLSVPSGAEVDAFIRNGILTIEVTEA
ncbi:hypothetical protein BRD00_09885 [Halobacteriales archaeon QS_8_69_26]|nr:MAG: hypothetical protein BRD00_09885 [Halobacteriales archaeon QS_8_69_26]